MTQHASHAQERRARADLREIFDEALPHVMPYLDPALGIMGVPMRRQAFLMLRERYPQLTAQDLCLLVPALERAIGARARVQAQSGSTV